MNITSPKLSFSILKENRSGLPVIIVAAGSSSRMGGEDKQLISISGIPVIARTMLAFERSADISKIILVTRRESIPKMQLLAEKYMISKLTDIVEGGDTRQQSVMCGIARLGADDKKVLVSDGARPFVTGRMIKDCVCALDSHDGCLCAVKVNDTVKEVIDGAVRSTVDRSRLYLAQTPQGITVSLYKKAAVNTDISVFTDDVSVLESVGADVIAVEGDVRNIKITTPSDIALAEIYVKEN
ncbi:MAG: 2-C-methyl-D-erythritol 4-phosphate cytidylyltransferase [Clostridia bacterium]|nr:2-C-methyl-D-erythritol 4-phosphate cytidylyltransferase [Clostridia bacterium]